MFFIKCLYFTIKKKVLKKLYMEKNKISRSLMMACKCCEVINGYIFWQWNQSEAQDFLIGCHGGHFRTVSFQAQPGPATSFRPIYSSVFFPFEK